MLNNLKFKGLSAFELKILACLFMLIDHIGVMLLPQVYLLRVVGRLAFPLFAFFIAEGCRYTKNKFRRFLSVFALGVVCEIFLVIFEGEYYGNILLTFSVSILLIYLLQFMKAQYKKSVICGVCFSVAFALCLVMVYFYCNKFRLDYGFFGVLTPVFCVLLDDCGDFSKKLYEKIDRKVVSLMMLGLALVLLVIFDSELDCQVWCLLSVLLLALYNGLRGKYKFKLGFYLFYPLHIVAVQAFAFYLDK